MKDLLSTIVSEFGKTLAQQLLKPTEQVHQVINEQVVSTAQPIVKKVKVKKVIAKETPVVETSETRKSVDNQFTHEDYEKLRPYFKYGETYENFLKMKGLKLDSCNISDLTPLKNLVNLETLWLCYNNISDISLLKDLVNLETLNLIFNNITDITSLQNLANLKWLGLRGNNIPLAQINKLRKCLPNCKIVY